MQIIKEIRLYHDGRPAMCVVRSRCYGSRLDYINQLVSAARETYPGLAESDVRVTQFAGERYARTYGIEFECPNPKAMSVPAGWQEISQLEYTF